MTEGHVAIADVDVALLADLVAERVLAGLRHALGPCAAESPEAGDLLTASEVAKRLGIGRSWVYAHAAELGARRLGDGPKGRLRFDAAVVAERLHARSTGERSGRARPPVPAGIRVVTGIEHAPIDLDLLPERWRRAVLSGVTTESGAAPHERPAPGPGGVNSGADRTLPVRVGRASSARPDSAGALTQGSRHAK